MPVRAKGVWGETVRLRRKPVVPPMIMSKSIRSYIIFAVLFILPILAYPFISKYGWHGNSDMYIMTEISSSVFAFCATILILTRFSSIGGWLYLAIGIGFALAGSRDLVHGIEDMVRLPDPMAEFVRFIPERYLADKVVVVSMFIIGAVFQRTERPIKNVMRNIFLYAGVGLMIGSLAPYFLEKSTISWLADPHELRSYLIDLIALVLSIAAIFLYINLYLNNRDSFHWSLVASLILSVAASSYMILAREMYDILFSLSHIFKILSFICPIIGVGFSLIEMYKQQEKAAAELTDTKLELERWSKTLEERVHDRTSELENANRELGEAKAEIEEFSRGLEEKVKERTFELSVLYDVSNSIAYTLDYAQLLKLIMESLLRVVNFDVCASIMFDEHNSHITVRPSHKNSVGFAKEVQNRLINSVSMLTGEDISGKHSNVSFIPPRPDFVPKEGRKFDKLRSFIDAPFIVRGKNIGMISVSSCKDNAFSENDIKLIHTIANQASVSMERIRALVTAEHSKMESMLKGMVEGVVMFDATGNIVVINPKAKELLKYSLGDEITATEVRGRLSGFGFRAERNKEDEPSITMDVDISDQDRKVLNIEETAVKSESGEKLGEVIIIRDVTQQKQLDEMKTEFISTVSHELRTPLSITKEGISQTMDGILGAVNEKQKHILGLATKNIDRLSFIINDLLNISKIEAGKVELRNIECDMVSISEQVISLFKPKADEKGLELKISCPNKSLCIFADSDKTTQILTNLVGNSIKFTENGRVEILLREKGNFVECTVADTGIGIHRDNIPQLFSKFKQFGRRPGSGEKGTGLGLSIAKGLVELHGGEIRAESAYGKGTKFIFTIPKFTPELSTKSYILNEIKRARANGSRLSVAALNITNLDELKKKMTDDKITVMLNDLSSKFNGRIREGDADDNDRIFKVGEKIVLVLTNCGKDGAKGVLERLQHLITAYFIEKKLDGKIKTSTIFATWPDDGEDTEIFDNVII